MIFDRQIRWFLHFQKRVLILINFHRVKDSLCFRFSCFTLFKFTSYNSRWILFIIIPVCYLGPIVKLPRNPISLSYHQAFIKIYTIYLYGRQFIWNWYRIDRLIPLQILRLIVDRTQNVSTLSYVLTMLNANNLS